MPYILLNKKTNQYRLFGSIPIMCRAIGYNQKQKQNLNWFFSFKKELVKETEEFLIIKTELEKGGKKSNNG